SVAKIPELFSFSFWTLARNVGRFAHDQVDKLAIGGVAGTAALGRYDVGREGAGRPVLGIRGAVVYRVYPVLASVKGGCGHVRQLVVSVIQWSALIAISAAIGVALVASDMTDLLLGPKWESIKPLIPWLALSYGITTLTSSAYSTLEAIGRAQLSAQLQWSRA